MATGHELCMSLMEIRPGSEALLQLIRVACDGRQAVVFQGGPPRGYWTRSPDGAILTLCFHCRDASLALEEEFVAVQGTSAFQSTVWPQKLLLTVGQARGRLEDSRFLEIKALGSWAAQTTPLSLQRPQWGRGEGSSVFFGDRQCNGSWSRTRNGMCLRFHHTGHNRLARPEEFRSLPDTGCLRSQSHQLKLLVAVRPVGGGEPATEPIDATVDTLLRHEMGFVVEAEDMHRAMFGGPDDGFT